MSRGRAMTGKRNFSCAGSNDWAWIPCISKMNSEALARKERSIAILKSEAIPYIEHLPVIETEEKSRRRAVEEVAVRALALCIVAVKGEGLEQPIVERIVRDYELATA